jgi:hypothetical protein
MNYNGWLRDLLSVEKLYLKGKKKKQRTAVFRRHQERFMKRLVELVQQLTLALGQVSKKQAN